MTTSTDRSMRFSSLWIEVGVSVCVFSVLMLFVAWYVRQERFIYFWDYVGYHDFYISLGSRFEANPWRALHFVYESIRGEDYNSLPTLFLMPFRLVFGPGRLAYLLAISVTFVFPSIVLFSHLLKSLGSDSTEAPAFDRAALMLLAVCAAGFSPMLWTPVLLGSVDVGGLVIILLVLLLYFRADLIDQTFGSLVSMALLLGLLVLYRRWYAYWVVGFFGALAICESVKCASDSVRRSKSVLIVRNVLILGGISIATFFAVATPIAWRMLTTDYRDIYSAYRSSHPVLHNVRALYDHFGLLTLVAAGGGIVLSAMKEKTRTITSFLCIQFVVTFVLFTRTQDFAISSQGQYFGIQHFYWALVPVVLFLMVCGQDLFVRAKSRAARLTVLLVVMAASVANLAATFVPRAGALLSTLNFSLPKVRHYPIVRRDMDQLQALLETLDDINKDSEATIYILASSYTLNSSIAHEGCFLLDPPHRGLAHKIAPTNDVDKRDGFPIQFLKARYVVLTVPFGYHLAPEDQKVIGVLADQLVKGEGIGRSYDKMNYEFPLEDGSSAFIYKKVRPLVPDDLKVLSQQFVQFYPNNRDKFELSPDVIREVLAL